MFRKDDCMNNMNKANREYTLPILRVNVMALIMIVPIGVIEFLPMSIIHGIEFQLVRDITFGGATFSLIKMVLAITLGIFIHELLHALGWVFFTKKKWKSIRFGVKWEYMTPYCHCKEPLRKYPFMLGAVLPLLILGILPVVWAYYSGNYSLWFFGFFFSIAAGGDIIAIWMLRKVKRHEMVQDHPSEMGFYVLEG